MELYNDHCTLFMERFPKLGLLAASWSAVPLPQETLPSVDLSEVDLLYVYGLGDGSSYEKLRGWLSQEKQRKLVFLEDETGVIASFLESPYAKDLLSDERVYLELISKTRRRSTELEAISEKFPIKKIEVLSLPSKKRKKFQAIRLALLRKTTFAHGHRFDRLHGYQPFHNFIRNLRHFPRSFYANRMKDAFLGVPAIVCGAGPSLQAAIPFLKEAQDKILIIAGGSTLAALSSQGIIPHFGMAIDPNLEEYDRFRNSFAFETPLLYCTRVFPGIFRTCNGPFGYMRTGIGGVPELWMEEQLGLKEPLLGDHLTSETMSVTSICLAWAQFLGCNPVMLSGVDLAYTDNRRYAPGVVKEDSFEKILAAKNASDQIYKKKDRLGRPVYTAVRWVMESACMSHFAKKHPETRFFNTTEGGIGFEHIPYRFLPEMLEEFCQEPLDLRNRVFQAISASPMPINTLKLIDERMKEMQESLDRVIGCLQILSESKEEWRRVVAELDLEEEMAYSYLFYDNYKLFGQEPNRWELFYEHARRYRAEIKSLLLG